jgi:hypothetical protein
MKVLIVTGGRDYRDRDRVMAELQHEQPDMVVQGGANGADGWAREWAGIHTCVLMTFPAKWGEWGKGAGPRRNAAMVEFVVGLDGWGYECSVLAFPGGRGTADCVTRARDVGLPVREVQS